MKCLNESLLYIRSIDGVLSKHSLKISMSAIFPTFSVMYFHDCWVFQTFPGNDFITSPSNSPSNLFSFRG